MPISKQEIADSLAQQFIKNMEFFKEVMPSIFEKFRDYNPQKIKITINDNGTLELINLQDNSPVYGEDPKAYAKRTVESYVQKPLWQHFNLEPTKMINPEQEAHTHAMNSLIGYLRDEQDPIVKKPLNKNTQLLIMLGIGLGYQIEELLNKTFINHLVIIEPHEDIFYSSLYTLDWRKLALPYEAKNTSINIILGKSPDEMISLLSSHIHSIGIHNAARPYIYNHMVSKEMAQSVEQCIDKFPIMISALGYFDDEQVGLTHSIHNIRSGFPFLTEHALLNRRFIDKPVFLIGNGPSLDKTKDFILENHKKAIIISCGSALSSLFKLGIKPDFHVELERTQPVREWIDSAIPSEFRKDIYLLAMNTVHPGVSSLFNRVGFAIKYNDLGGTFIGKFMGPQKNSVTLVNCNPTVSNAGMSFAAALGFTNIYLFGIDMGYPEGTMHHSKLSFHYDLQEKQQERYNTIHQNKNNQLQTNGNFGGQVTTTQVFYRTKLAIEAILQSNKLIQCVNTAYGAKIDGSTPLEVNDINTSNWIEFDKELTCRNIFNKNFSRDHIQNLPTDDEIKNIFHPAVNYLSKIIPLFNDASTSVPNAYDKLDISNKEILELKEKNPLCYELLRGSAKAYEFALGLSLNIKHEQKNSLEAFNIASGYYVTYMQLAIKAIETNLLRVDNKMINIKLS